MILPKPSKEAWDEWSNDIKTIMEGQKVKTKPLTSCRPVTNNWLKMHGIPMCRKVHIK